MERIDHCCKRTGMRLFFPVRLILVHGYEYVSYHFGYCCIAWSFFCRSVTLGHRQSRRPRGTYLDTRVQIGILSVHLRISQTTNTSTYSKTTITMVEHTVCHSAYLSACRISLDPIAQLAYYYGSSHCIEQLSRDTLAVTPFALLLYIKH